MVGQSMPRQSERMHAYDLDTADNNVVPLGRCASCPTQVACLSAWLEPEQRALLPAIFSTREPLAEDTHLYRAGESVQAQYHVRSGAFKTYAINAEGDEYVTGFYLPGDVLGQVQQDGCHAESAVALETSSVCLLTDAGVTRCAEHGMAGLLLRQHAEKATDQTRHHLNLKQTSAPARFAGFCLLYGDRLAALGRSRDFLPTPMSRTDIASYLGMTLESLSRVISKLGKKRVIRATPDSIEILERDALEELGAHVR